MLLWRLAARGAEAEVRRDDERRGIVVRPEPRERPVSLVEPGEGFRRVYHAGVGGWVYEAYLSWGDGGVAAGTFTTMAAVNLRAEPSANAKIKLVVPAGASVIDYDGAPLVNGYRGVEYNGTVGWVYNAYLN